MHIHYMTYLTIRSAQTSAIFSLAFIYHFMCLHTPSGVMDDEDDRRLLDILGYKRYKTGFDITAIPSLYEWMH